MPVCALFKAPIVDRPDPVPDTPDTSGGTVEHEVYMIEGIILRVILVIELRLYFKDLRDHFASVLLELACECPWTLLYRTDSKAHVAQRHKYRQRIRQPTSRLGSYDRLYFLQYDGFKFTLYENEIIVSARSRSAFLDEEW